MDDTGTSAGLAGRIRAIVADQVGVAPNELHPALSLADELAVDSLDLADLLSAIEDELGVDIPEATLDEVRTYADLVDHVLAAIATERTRRRARDLPAVRIVARLSGPTESGRPIRWGGTLTPYLAQTLVEQARRLGPGSRLEVDVATADAGTAVHQVRQHLSDLAPHGVEVSVQAAPSPGWPE